MPEYFWYDPYSAEFAGFALRDGVYEPIAPDTDGRLACRRLDLTLVRWEGEYRGVEATWLRWASTDGTLLSTAAERAAQEQQRAADEQQRADDERQRAEEERQRADDMRQLLAQAETRIADLEARLARIENERDAPPHGDA